MENRVYRPGSGANKPKGTSSTWPIQDIEVLVLVELARRRSFLRWRIWAKFGSIRGFAFSGMVRTVWPFGFPTAVRLLVFCSPPAGVPNDESMRVIVLSCATVALALVNYARARQLRLRRKICTRHNSRLYVLVETPLAM
ncbi:hypothetical protein FN846DRAFT_281656 [Sphaerosporella brunnea]|uniref:Uncharacterized protein n=1 Tax=Sphaerosporella brunnea TaxID=1250544 RepID=A0A5J5ENB7_9PEZI|nr:hypothetical protein FN846DRAFT_281656 [Sphaerosporella brunnea]